MSHQYFGTPISATLGLCQQPISMGDLSRFYIYMLPKFEMLHKVNG